jgi:hypothetical protein
MYACLCFERCNRSRCSIDSCIAMNECMYVCMRVCMYACMYVCAIYVCMCAMTPIYAMLHLLVPSQHTCMHAYTCILHSPICYSIRASVNIHIYADTHIRTDIHTCIYTCIYIPIIFSYLLFHSGPYRKTYTHTYIYIYIHACIYIPSIFSCLLLH